MTNINRREIAETAFQAVIDRFYQSSDHLFHESVPAQPQDRRYSYVWPLASALAATNELARLTGSDRYRGLLRDQLAGLERYWSAPGYMAYVADEGGGTRFYDDNEWLALELVQAAQVLGEQRWLDRARAVFDFVAGGWSDDFGGGLYWNEERKTKNTCSNGPAAVLALRLHQATGEQKYLEWGRRIMAWLEQRLRAPEGVYWDKLDQGGKVDNRTFTYNTGVMIQANLLLFNITGSPEHFATARDLATSSLARFATRQFAGLRFFPPTPWFNTVLLRGYVALWEANGDASFANAMLDTLDYAWQHARDAAGFVVPDWSGRGEHGKSFATLIDQMAVVEALALGSRLTQTPVTTSPRPQTGPSNAPSGPRGAATLQTARLVVTAKQPALSPLGTAGQWQTQADQYVCYAEPYGTLAVDGRIAGYYADAGGPGGPLGFPVDAARDAGPSPAGTRGLGQRFEGCLEYPPDVANGRPGNAAIYWTGKTGAHVTWFEIGAVYERLGGPTAGLGFPAGDRAAAGTSPTGVTGYGQAFEMGAIYQTAEYGAWSVLGAIHTYYELHGGPHGLLGYPMAGQQPAPNASGQPAGLCQRFEGHGPWPRAIQASLGLACGASIYWSDRTGAHSTWGVIGACYEQHRGTAGGLGFPTSEVLRADGQPAAPGDEVAGYGQQFEHGSISWDVVRGAVVQYSDAPQQPAATPGPAGV